jgi:hypothetical protein
MKYVLGDRSRTGVVRDPAPAILRGDPQLIARVIDDSPHQWKYTSGVLSLAPGEKLTPAQENRLMDEFEAIAFAGLSPDRYAILWVRHAHAGHPELHFISPRVELISGKSLNMAPPGRESRALFDTWRSKTNAELGLADPDDPARRRVVSLSSRIAKLLKQRPHDAAARQANVRQSLAQFLLERIREGSVRDHADVVRAFKQAGFKVVRQGERYMTVLHPTTGERFRLRGACFESNWVRKDIVPKPALLKPDPAKAAELARQLQPLIEARAQYNLKRYGPDTPYDRTRITPDRSPTTTRSSIPPARPDAGRHADRLVGATRRFSRTTEELELAGARLGRARRAFDRDYETALSCARRRYQVKSLLRQYAVSLNQQDREQDMERELEL